MKTLTVTFHHSNNYGALLQAYALQQAILSTGHQNTIFEYPYNNSFYGKLDVKNPSAAAKTAYLNFIKFLRRSEIRKRKESFSLFHKNHMNLSKIYHTMEELRNDCGEYDALITGSDQVWRFSGDKEFIPARFLDFGKPDIRKISYAASIERLNYTDEQKDLIKKWLKDFYTISLRERSAADYIHDITGYDTKTVLDPVFLLDKEQWLKIATEPRIKEKYILCYQVQKSPMMQETVDYLKKLTGYKTVAVLPYAHKWIKTDYSLFDVSPEEFLGLYNGATIVVSGSFHGTAFAHIFNKPVYATTRKGSEGRIVDVMKLMGVEEFCIFDQNSLLPPDSYCIEIVKKNLASEREKSLSFLKECLINE